MATLQLSMFGQGSPLRGVVVGPLRVTGYFLISSRTSAGMAQPWAARFSMVRPSMSAMTTRPDLTSSLSRNSRTRFDWAAI